MTIQKLPGSAITPGTITVVQLESSVATTVQTGGGPKLTNIQITDNAYTILDDTAVAVAGGYIKITGTGFVTGCSVIIGSLVATSVSFISSTEVRAQVPAQSAGTYTVYLVNPDGGVGIRVNGLNYSSTPTWSTTSPLPGGVKDTAISIQLVATSNSAVTFSIQSGSTLPTGLTLSSGGLLSGTVTGISIETTYNFTLVATDAENQDTPQAFQITIVVGDPYYRLVTLHLPGTGINLAQNNTFLDGSTNNFTITRNGNTTQGTFSPFSQTGWGNRFNFATPDALRPSATTISNFGTGAFTVEFWINFQNTNNAGIYYGGNGGGSVFLDYYSGSLRLGISGGAIPISYAFTPTIGRWYHVAFTRSSTTDTLYIDGTSVATGPDSQNYPSDSSPYVGSWNGSTYNGTAFISNFRIVKGVTVYTVAFTPPTSPLTATQSAGTNIAAITTGQTSLLTCQSNRFVDNGQGNTGNTGFTITVNGSPSVQAFSPFNPTSSWSAVTNGGSGYFDGTGDFLSTTNVSALQLTSSTAFTIEFWWYPTSLSAQQYVQSAWVVGSTGYAIAAGVSTFSVSELAFFDGTTWRKIGNPVLNAWNHIAIVSSGTSNTGYLYLNGSPSAAFTVASTINYTSGTWYLGQNSSSGAYANGYVTDFRLLKGTNLYPSGTAFTPPTAPLTAITNTSLLLNFTNAGIYDATSKNDLETVGNAQISTAQSKWGGSSMAFDGTGDYLVMPSSVNLAFGTGDFTLEMWAYFTSVANFPTLTDSRVSGSSTTGFNLGLSSAKLQLYTNTSLLLGATTLSINTWYYIAVSRESGALKIFLDGSQDASTSNSTNWSDTTFIVGAAPGGVNAMTGYIQDLRVTKGKARTITTPTAAFPTL